MGSPSPAKKTRGGKAKTTTSPKKKATKKETKKEVALSPSPAKKKRRVTVKASPPKKKQKKETTKVAAPAMKHSVGTKIAKKFKRDIYYGTIKSVDAKNKWYHVVYDDGDEEDFEDDEIDKYLVKKDAVGGKKKTRGKKK